MPMFDGTDLNSPIEDIRKALSEAEAQTDPMGQARAGYLRQALLMREAEERGQDPTVPPAR